MRRREATMIRSETDRIANSTMAILALIALAALGGCSRQTTVPPPQQIEVTPQQVNVTPATVHVFAGSSYQFSVSVLPANALNDVHWSISGTGCSGTACGNVDGTGNYSAPLLLPSPSTVTIIATSILDQTKLGEATATIVSPQPSLSFSAGGNMTTVRAGHIAILLPSGKVLIAGGVN